MSIPILGGKAQEVMLDCGYVVEKENVFAVIPMSTTHTRWW